MAYFLRERAWMCCWLSDSVYSGTAIARLLLPAQSQLLLACFWEACVWTLLFGHLLWLKVISSFCCKLRMLISDKGDAHVSLKEVLKDFKCLSRGLLLLLLNTTESGNESLVERELHSPMRSSSNQYYSWKKTPFQ